MLRLPATILLTLAPSLVACFSFVSRKSFHLPCRNKHLQRTDSTMSNTVVCNYHSASASSYLCMRDRSESYWFSLGDSVRVVASDVQKGGINLQHRVGRVVETWEKCHVDPTCCCAEQVDTNMAVRVEFQGTEVDPTVAEAFFFHYFAEDELVRIAPEDDPLESATLKDTNSKSILPSIDGVGRVAFKVHYLQALGLKPRGLFALDSSSSLNGAEEENYGAQKVDGDSLPFNGMSCAAFKMDHLQSASQKPRGIYSYEPTFPAARAGEQGSTAAVSGAENSESPPFDGMSCAAFKVNHLQSASSPKPRGINSFEPTSPIAMGGKQGSTTARTGAKNAESLPFDGMSCAAFKVNHLQSASSQKPRGIFSYDPSKPRTTGSEED